MNNKILITLGSVLIVIVFFLVFNNSGSEVKNPLEESNKIVEKTSQNEIKQKNKFIESKNLFKNKTTENVNNDTEIDKKTYQNNIGNEVVNINKNEFLNNYDKENNEYVFAEKEFDNFVDENNLEEVESIDKSTKIYVKNLPIRNDFAPPMPPVLIRIKFKEKTKIIPINSNLISSNKKIYVVNQNKNDVQINKTKNISNNQTTEKQDTEKQVEVKEIDTKDISSFAPPAIGQN